MPIAEGIRRALGASSMIRKMFDEGAALKREHGADRVFDFSLGSPALQPPPELREALARLAAEGAPGAHGYAPSAGLPEARAAMAAKASRDHRMELDASCVVMSAGAAGALNAVFKAVCSPGDEIAVSRPFFPEYAPYAANCGARLVVADSLPDFGLDVGAIAKALSPRTAAVLVNSPCNPTGKVYPAQALAELAGAMRAHGARVSRMPYLVADEPYREIAFGAEVPPVLPVYEESFAVYSFSKSLSLPGERIGYVAASPAMRNRAEVIEALAYATRVLGFVGAPALMQRAVAQAGAAALESAALSGSALSSARPAGPAPGCGAEEGAPPGSPAAGGAAGGVSGEYLRRREAMMAVLSGAGIECAAPEGAFYAFFRVPPRGGGEGEGGAPDDIAFAECLKRHLILGVPGSGFGQPGWLRLAFCAGEKAIRASAGAFASAMAEWRSC